MAIEYILDEGLDPTALTQVNASQLLQIIRQALPKSTRGFVIFSASIPDVASNPWMARSLWVDTSTTIPYTVKEYNPSSMLWVALSIGTAVIGTAQLATSAVTPIKMLPGAAKTFLFTDGALVVGWSLVNSAIDDNTLQIIKLVRSITAGQFLRTNLAGSAIEWFTLDATQFITDNTLVLNKLSITGGTAGQSIRLNATPNGWEFYTPLTTFTPADNSLALIKMVKGVTSGQQARVGASLDQEYFNPLLTSRYITAPGDYKAVPAAAGTDQFSHSLGAVPNNFDLRLVCIGAHLNWAVGDELPLSALSYGGDFRPVLVFSADASVVFLRRDSASGVSSHLLDKTSGTSTVITDANLNTNFKLKASAVRYTQI
jgi:hypothetical protein